MNEGTLTKAAYEEAAELVFQAVLYDNADLLEELLRATPEATAARDAATGRTALFCAAQRGYVRCVDVLLHFAADNADIAVNRAAGPRDVLRTPLLVASAMGHAEVVARLLDYGADLFYCDANGDTALQLAQVNGCEPVVELLMSSIEGMHNTAVQMRANLCAACIDNDRNVVMNILADAPCNARSQILNGLQHNEEKSALFIACEHGRAEIVRVLLTVSQHSIIHMATGDTVLHAAVASQDAETVDIVVHKFPYLMEVANNDGHIALHWACQCGNLEVLKTLLEVDYPKAESKWIETNGGRVGRNFFYKFVCDFNATENECRTPLHLAVANGHTPVVQYMSDYKILVHYALPPSTADDDVDEDGNLASGSGIGGNGSDVHSSGGGGLEAEYECPFLTDVYCSSGRTALMIACASTTNLEIVRLLLRMGADVNLPIALTELEIRNLQPMEEARCTGSGALIEAARAGNTEMVKLLLNSGAFDYENKALAVAIQNRHHELISGFLCQLTFRDTEFRINKRCQQLIGGSSNIAAANDDSSNFVAASAAFLGGGDAGTFLTNRLPTTACQLNWHNAALEELRVEWLVAACIFFNSRIRHRRLALVALTRVDVSKNRLKQLPGALFQLPSLHTLNLEQNYIERLDFPSSTTTSTSSVAESNGNVNMPYLQELSLAGNYLCELPNQLFSDVHFPALRILNVSGNRLRFLAAALWNAPKLQDLNVMNNEITRLFGRMDDASMTNRSRQTAASNRQALSRRQLHHRYGSGGASASRVLMAMRNQQRNEAESNRELAGKEPVAVLGGDEKVDGDGVVNVTTMDISRINIWQKKVDLSNIDDDGLDSMDGPQNNNNQHHRRRRQQSSYSPPASPSDGASSRGGALRVLNLSGNKLQRVPVLLACCCPRLTHLDLSMNEIVELGPVECLPSALRHLNLSHNQLTKLFQRVESPQLTCHRSVGGEDSGADLSDRTDGPTRRIRTVDRAAAADYSISRHTRSRSKSVARNQRSLSVIHPTISDEISSSRQSRRDGDKPAESVGPAMVEPCVHKRHCKLEALKTLNLSHNQLGNVELLALPFGGDQLKTAVGAAVEEFNWKENGQQLKSYLLFPALTTIDLSFNHLRTIPPTISLLGYLSVLNVASNAELESLPSEVGLLDKLWNIGIQGCAALKEPLKSAIDQKGGHYKTTEILALLRNKLENSKPYPKLKLMLLGGHGVGKSSLMRQIRQEGSVSKKALQSQSWSRRMGHPSPPLRHHSSSPSAAAVASQFFNFDSSLIDIGEWTFEPKRKSSSAHSTTASSSSQTANNIRAVTFRTWDFCGQQTDEFFPLQHYFFTRRCLYVVVWKVTDGEMALNELHEWLVSIQARAPNSTVIIVGTHLDCVRENASKFAADYLKELDRVIKERFVNASDADKKGLPAVMASIYVSTRSRDDCRALCDTLYQVAVDLRSTATNRRHRLLAEKVPDLYIALEKVIVSATDELRRKYDAPILRLEDLWSLAAGPVMEECGRPFRDLFEFRRACQFLHENGIIVYFDDTWLRDFVFLDPPWLCSLLYGAIAAIKNAIDSGNDYCKTGSTRFDGSGNTALSKSVVLNEPRSTLLLPNNISSLSLNSNKLAITSLSPSSSAITEMMSQHTPQSSTDTPPLIDSRHMFNILKQALRHFGSTAAQITISGATISALPVDVKFRLVLLNLLSKFELALPCLNRTLLLPPLLSDEYALRAGYPGARVTIRTKVYRWTVTYQPKRLGHSVDDHGTGDTINGSSTDGPMSPFIFENNTVGLVSPIRRYLAQRRLVRRRLAVPHSIDEEETMMARAIISSSSSTRLQSSTEQKVSLPNRCSCMDMDIDMKEPGKQSSLSSPSENASGFTQRQSPKMATTIDSDTENTIRRVYLLQYVPPGFWPRLTTRLLDDDQMCQTLTRLFTLTSCHHQRPCHSGSSDVFDDVTPTTINSPDVRLIIEVFNHLAGEESKEMTGKEEEDGEEEETSFITNPLLASKAKAPVLASRSDYSLAKEKVERTRTNSASPAKEPRSRMDDQSRPQAKMDGRDGFTWLLWKTGLEVRSFGTHLLSLKQFLPMANVLDVDYSQFELMIRSEDGLWMGLSSGANTSIVELLIPAIKIDIVVDEVVYHLEMDRSVATKLLVAVTNIIDDLLEDWFPALGTRHVRTSEGRLLVDRLVPCHICASDVIQSKNQLSSENGSSRKMFLFSVEECILAASLQNRHTKKQDKQSFYPAKTALFSSWIGSITDQSNDSKFSSLSANHNIEQLSDLIRCPEHVEAVNLSKDRLLDVLAPDVRFADLTAARMAEPERIRFGRIVGRGAFGFVFNGFIRQRNEPFASEVALKVLEPVDIDPSRQLVGGNLMTTSMNDSSAMRQFRATFEPALTSGAYDTNQKAFQAFRLKWAADPRDSAARGYQAARQELNILLSFDITDCGNGGVVTTTTVGRRNAHVTSLIAFAVSPMTLVFELAPLGALDAMLARYRRSNATLQLRALQQTCVQIAKALEFLHANRIIYRDLKSENVLTWRFPQPLSASSANAVAAAADATVVVKLGDYGISRRAYPSGICKGYGGTEAFMAPEMMRYGGEQEYTEKIDCYSFGMFIYELIALKKPYEGREQMKDVILEGRRPHVAEKELLFPSCVLDLMVTCWSDSASSRPSASQLVGICSAPEFSRLMDVAVVEDTGPSEADVTTIVAEADDREPGSGQMWMARHTGFIHVYSFSRFGWIEKQIVRVGPSRSPTELSSHSNANSRVTGMVFARPSMTSRPNASTIVTITAIRQTSAATVWAANSCGQIAVYCTKTFARLSTFSVVEPSATDSEVIPASDFWIVRKIDVYASRQLVVVGCPQSLLIYRLFSDSAALPRLAARIGRAYGGGKGNRIEDCITAQALPKLLDFVIVPGLSDWQIWTAHQRGKLIVHHMSDSTNRLVFSTSLYHFHDNNTRKDAAEEGIDGDGKRSAEGGSSPSASAKDADADVCHLLASCRSTSAGHLSASKNVRLVWSTLSNDARVFQWRGMHLARTLNCAKLLPVSESLSSMNVDEMVGRQRCCVTAIRLMSSAASEKLLVGTNRGVVIVVDAEPMLPLTSFQPYASAVEHILVYDSSSNAFSPSFTNQYENNSEAEAKTVASALSNSASMDQMISATVTAADTKQRPPLARRIGRTRNDYLFDSTGGGDAPQSINNDILPRPSSGDALSRRGAHFIAPVEAITRGVKGVILGGTPAEYNATSAITSPSEGLFITVGRGYRCLLSRFLNTVDAEGGCGDVSANNCISADADGQKPQRCAIFWRSDDAWQS